VRNLIVVDAVREWPFRARGVEVIDARTYLAQPECSASSRIRLFNLCRSYKYQSVGYYVTLLAAARGHRPLPDLTTLLDLKSQTMVRSFSDELDRLLQQTLRPIRSREFTLSVYFGHSVARRYERLSRELFSLCQAPLVRATFARPNGKWILRTLNPIPVGEIPGVHRRFVLKRAGEYFAGRPAARPKRASAKYDMAILRDPKERDPPSNAGAIDGFVDAAQQLGIRTELITRDNFARLAEFDALFIRETTHVNHHTYRFARQAVNEGLIVVDDPESILTCGNKVYLAELLSRKKIPIPRTIVVDRGNVDQVGSELGFPCVLKLPDAAFSQGVVKVDDEEALTRKIDEFLESSALVVAQEFLPTSFDWRIAIFDRKPLFACKYHMASRHWQIIKRDKSGRPEIGPVGNVPLKNVPRLVVETALKAANLIGDGLYGVDLKQVGNRVFVIEINDNPNIDAGNEDRVDKGRLYERIIKVFVNRIEQKKAEVSSVVFAAGRRTDLGPEVRVAARA
jgi:glutathione synthase/RimK-type ligase-like ATP-grasp enzyme